MHTGSDGVPVPVHLMLLALTWKSELGTRTDILHVDMDMSIPVLIAMLAMDEVVAAAVAVVAMFIPSMLKETEN